MKTLNLISISAFVGIIAVLTSTMWGDANFLSRIVLGFALSEFTFILLDSALDRNSSFLMLVFCYYNIGMFIFPGMLHCAQGYFPFFDLTYESGVILSVSQLVALYATMVLAGYLTSKPRLEARPLKSGTTEATISDTTIIVLSLISSVVAVACVGAVGLGAFLTRRADVDLAGTEPTPLSLILTNLPQVTSLCAALIAVERAITKRNPFIIILSIPLVFFAAITNNPLAIARFGLFGIVLIVVYASVYVTTVFTKLSFIACAVVGQILLLPLADSFARGAAGSRFEFNPLSYISSSGDFDGLQSTINTYILAQMEGLSFGYRLLGAVLTFVPRSVWSNKPYATGQAAAQSLGLTFTNLSAPIPAEIYIDFGIVGLIVVPFLIGYVGKIFDYAAQRAILRKAPMATRLVYGGVIGFVVILSRGSLLAVVSPIYLYFGFVSIWRVLHSRNVRKLPEVNQSARRACLPGSSGQ